MQLAVLDEVEKHLKNSSSGTSSSITTSTLGLKDQRLTDLLNQLTEKVLVSFDIDGLDPKLCPNTGTPVQGGFETEQIFYLLKKIVQSGRKFIGFDLVEIGVGDNNEWDANVGAHILWRLANLLVASNQ